MNRLPSELCKYCTLRHACSPAMKCRKITDIEATQHLPKKENWK